MKLVKGIWLPDEETHFPAWPTDRLRTYQFYSKAKAFRYVKDDGVALDIGAHVGLWSLDLADIFKRVHAFEPVPDLCACFERNVKAPHVTLHKVALGDRMGLTGVRYDPSKSGETTLAETGELPIRTLDSFAFPKVDFIKIDVEGYEPFVIEGAKETIKRCRPVMVVEQKPHGLRWGFDRYRATHMLMELGMLPRDVHKDDVVMVWP